MDLSVKFRDSQEGTVQEGQFLSLMLEGKERTEGKKEVWERESGASASSLHNSIHKKIFNSLTMAC